MQETNIIPIHKTRSLTTFDIYDKLLATLKSGVWRFNFQTQEVLLEPSFLNIIGYRAEDFPTLKISDVIHLVHPREKAFFDFLTPPFHRNLMTKCSFEFRMLHRNGNWIWVENHCENISYTTENEPECLVGFVQDISEKKNKELLALKYKDLLKKTNEAASIGTWEVDLVNNKIDWSEVTKRIHEVADDYNPTLETGINFYKEGIHRTQITNMFEKCVAKGIGFDDEFIIVTQNGKEKWVRSIGVAVMEKGICTKVYGVFHDIDARIRTIQDLAITEEKFRKTFDFAGIGMAMVNMNSEWLRVNQSLCDMLGYTMDEFLSLSHQDFTHPDDLEQDKILLTEALKGNLDDYEIEKRYIHKNGTIVWSILTVSVVRDDTGAPLHLLSQLNDITDRKYAENKVKEVLAVAKEQNNRLLNFAHIVSHNLRSHSGNLEMLLDLMVTDNPEIVKEELFPLLKEAVGQLEETVQNLNKVAVLNTKTELNLLGLNLAEYVNNAITNINSFILDESVQLENKVDPALKVLAIPAYMDSILLNFFTNAIKYQSLERAPKIEVTAFEKDKHIVLSIKDNGLGIDLAAHGSKLFGLYKTFHKHQDARGLGLFITRNQIEAMGGRVEVKSEVNVGTTFFIYLRNEST